MTIADPVEIKTPDFYQYPWTGLASAELRDRFVICTWSDGVTLRAFDLWLQENTVGTTIDEQTRESVADPADLDVSPDGAAVAAEVQADGSLVVTWRAGDTATYHPGWLRHVAEGRHRAASWLPEQTVWEAETVSGEPPTHDGTNLDRDPSVLQRWVDDLIRYGLARLRGVSLDPDLLLAVGPRIGAIRDTNFGLVWDVKANPDPNSTANTNFRLCPHTDLPTRETPPGFQFLHCLENTATGGFSTMADGLAVARHIEREYPEHYEALTTLRWVFFNRGPSVDHRWSGPIIDLGVAGSPLTIRAFHPVRGFPDMAEEDMPRAYAALQCFGRIAADPRFQISYPFAPGDIVGFDNRRVMHGRDRYESSGHRHLRGLYIDHDEIHSFARVNARASAATEPGADT
ncbi:MAG: TauD/TfdA family dioxygenase [Actinomycetota bacterium]